MASSPPNLRIADQEPDDVALARAGDRVAFGRLYRRYVRLVHGILLTRVAPGEALDLVQDVFVSALRNLDSLDASSNFGSWIASIARNRGTDHLRLRRQCAPLPDDALSEPPASPQALLVVELIRALPEGYRELTMLRFVEGMSGPEIAKLTGLTPGSVRVKLCRGLKLLRERLGGER